MFGCPILEWRVWPGCLKFDAKSGEKSMDLGIKKFSPIVHLKIFGFLSNFVVNQLRYLEILLTASSLDFKNKTEMRHVQSSVNVM